MLFSVVLFLPGKRSNVHGTLKTGKNNFSVLMYCDGTNFIVWNSNCIYRKFILLALLKSRIKTESKQQLFRHVFIVVYRLFRIKSSDNHRKSLHSKLILFVTLLYKDYLCTKFMLIATGKKMIRITKVWCNKIFKVNLSRLTSLTRHTLFTQRIWSNFEQVNLFNKDLLNI